MGHVAWSGGGPLHSPHPPIGEFRNPGPALLLRLRACLPACLSRPNLPKGTGHGANRYGWGGGHLGPRVSCRVVILLPHPPCWVLGCWLTLLLFVGLSLAIQEKSRGLYPPRRKRKELRAQQSARTILEDRIHHGTLV